MKQYLKLILLIEVFSLFYLTETNAQNVISLQDRRELFVDYFLIDHLINAELKMQKPQDQGVAFYFDRPWEGQFSGVFTIIKDGNLLRAYYRGLPDVSKDHEVIGEVVTCYAESDDGIHWRKPNLGIYEIRGTRENNVILTNDVICPFLDTNPEAKTDQRYKAIGGGEQGGLVAYISPDGIHWKKLQEKPIFTEGIFDSQNVAFWSEAEQKYLCYFRTWTGGKIRKGFRSVGRTTSDDFIHWSAPEEMTYGDTPYEHIYTQQTSPYFRAPHIYVAIGARFIRGLQVLTDEQAKELKVHPKYYDDASDAIFMTSRGGNQYDRTFMESFIRPGTDPGNWVSRTNYPALNVVQTGPEEMSVYVKVHYAQPTAYLKRYSLRIDGFSSLSAGYEGGEALTKPFTFEGEELELNFSTSAAGKIIIEIQDEDGKPVPGFTMAEAQEIIGDETKRIVSWNGMTEVSRLASKPIRLKIFLKDADIFSLKFNKK